MRGGPFAWGAAFLLVACQSPPEQPTRHEGSVARCASLQGEEALDQLGALDPAARRVVAERGMPDFLCEAGGGIHLVYTRRDEAVTLSTRSAAAAPAVQTAISGELLELLPTRARGRIEARRILAETKPRPKAAARREASEAPRAPVAAAARAPVPAAVAPAPGAFDVEALVARLARTTNFGAPGLSGWQLGTLPDGTLQAVARERDKLYEVRAQRASVVVNLDANRPHTVAGAALACRRLNDAIFRPDPQPAKNLTIELLYAVATDPRHRRVERKISGRTLTAQKVGDGGQVRFTIYAR